jgi:hypothetical protein
MARALPRDLAELDSWIEVSGGDFADSALMHFRPEHPYRNSPNGPGNLRTQWRGR